MSRVRRRTQTSEKEVKNVFFFKNPVLRGFQSVLGERFVSPRDFVKRNGCVCGVGVALLVVSGDMWGY